MIERTQTMCVVLSYEVIATKIGCIVTVKKLWYFLIDVCYSLHSLRLLLIIKLWPRPWDRSEFYIIDFIINVPNY